MQMVDRVPDWMTPVAWVYIGLSLAAAVVVAADIHLGRRRHARVATELVWITSALYLGPFAVPLYRSRGRAAVGAPEATTTTTTATTTAPAPASSDVVAAGLPGGGASAVAHLIGVPLVLASGLTIAGIDLWVMILVIGALAMLLLFVYERGTLPLGAAATAAVVTVLAFDVGMGGWMLLLHVNEFMPPATEGSFWFLMQVGIILGLATGYPAVRWLRRSRRTAEPVPVP